MTPEHTAMARAAIGRNRTLVVEQAAVLATDRDTWLRRAHDHLNIYTGLPNYRNNWLRLGFSTEDLPRGGSERLKDALVVRGGEVAIAERVAEHLAAGADHVCLQVLGDDPVHPLPELRRLASALEELR